MLFVENNVKLITKDTLGVSELHAGERAEEQDWTRTGKQTLEQEIDRTHEAEALASIPFHSHPLAYLFYFLLRSPFHIV